MRGSSGWGDRPGGVVTFVAGVMMLLLWALTGQRVFSQDAANPTARYIETFTTYAHADGARTTAWWDRSQGHLTLRPPDVGNVRRVPVLAPLGDGGMQVVWVEDRGDGAFIWSQRLDGYGNRLEDEDRQLFPWAGSRWQTALGERALSLATISDDEWFLLWSDDDGVWAFRQGRGATGQDGLVTHLADFANAPVQVRCWQALCAVLWQEEASSQVRVFDGTMTPLARKQLLGKALVSWTDEGEVWLAWQEDGGFVAQRFDKMLVPRDQLSPKYPSSSTAIADIVAYNDTLLLLSLDPTRLIQMYSTAPAIELAEYPQASAARLLASAEDVVLVLQTTADTALWLERYYPLTSSRLLRLGLPGAEPVLGEVALTSRGMVAVVWREGKHVFARKWMQSGWSPWRHEVTPAYAATDGWVAWEGLAHSLEVNPPQTAVSAVTLEADTQLAGGSVQFFVSNQGPKLWKAITPGTEVTFATPGTRLRWYARLRRSAWGTAPQIERVSLVYQYQYVRYWPRINR